MQSDVRPDLVFYIQRRQFTIPATPAKNLALEGRPKANALCLSSTVIETARWLSDLGFSLGASDDLCPPTPRAILDLSALRLTRATSK